jgi:arylsulfatase
VRNRPFVVTAHVTLDGDASPSGVLVAQGSVLGGWSFHVVDNSLVYVHNLAGWRLYRVDAPLPSLAAGDHTFAMDFEAPGVTLLVDGNVIGEGVVKRTLWSRFSLTGAGLTAGWSPDFSAADEDYRGRFAFAGGTLHFVDIDVPGEPVVDPEAEVQDIVASQ